MTSKFTLIPHHWYAMECIFASSERHYSPIWISRVMGKKTGAGLLDVGFWHANYAEGVQDKTYRLQVLNRSGGALIAARLQEDGATDGMVILITGIHWGWLHAHFPEHARVPRENTELQAWLDSTLGHG